MPQTYVIYNGVAGEDTYAITFDRLSNAHVNVYKDGAILPSADYSIVGDDVVLDEVTTGAETIELRRRTPDTPDFDFVSASTYNPTDTQGAYTQAIYRATEVIEQVDRRLNAIAEEGDIVKLTEKINGDGGASYALSGRVTSPTDILVLVGGQGQIPTSAALDDPTDPLSGGNYSVYDDQLADVSYLVFDENIPLSVSIDVWYLTSITVTTPDVVVSNTVPTGEGQTGQLWAVI